MLQLLILPIEVAPTEVPLRPLVLPIEVAPTKVPLQPLVHPTEMALIEVIPQLTVLPIQTALTEVPLQLPVFTTISHHSQHHYLLQSHPFVATNRLQPMVSSLALSSLTPHHLLLPSPLLAVCSYSDSLQNQTALVANSFQTPSSRPSCVSSPVSLL